MKTDLIEKLRIFRLLMHKCCLVRRRNSILNFFNQIFFPLFLLFSVWLTLGASSSGPKEVPEDTYFRMISPNELIDNVIDNTRIYYAPVNDFTKELMKDVHKCFKDRANMKGYETENLFMVNYYHSEGNEVKDHAAIIFDKSMDRSTKHLRYKIRKQETMDPFLYNNDDQNMTEYYTRDYPIVQIQYCLGRAFVGLKNRQKLGDIPNMYIQRMPYPAHTKLTPLNPLFRQSITGMLWFVLLWPLFNEISRPSDEKFSGINVIMSVNGISNAMNLLSWIVSGLLYLGVVFVLPILYMLTSSGSDSLPFLYYGNTFLLFLVITFHLAHSFVFGIHATAYCTRSTFVPTAIAISILVQLFIFKPLTDAHYLAPYLGMIFPIISFDSAIKEINSYEIMTEGIQWYNLFTNSNPKLKIGSSIGMYLMLSLIAMVFHFLLALYVLAILPGRYGAGKHPLFFLKYFRSESKDNNYSIESLEYDDTNPLFFESPPAEVYVPSIQIRNLKKEHSFSLFSKEKVYALRGVSVDFYEGQITSLLGHNGAGKTTMFSVLSGIANATDGTVLINSKNLRENPSEIRQDMGLCTQEDIYFTSLTVSQQVEFFGRLRKKNKSKAAVQEEVRVLLEKFHLTDKADALPDTLSGGQKRRLCLAIALIGDASILILDEPTSGLDPESRRVVWNILLKMRGRKTILISTHNMEEADILGDRIAIMHTGRLKCYGTSLFLKRLIGQDKVEITLSIEPRSDPEKIRLQLHRDGVIVSRIFGKLVVSIPNSPQLPDTLDNLEKKKEELGVSAFSVSLISLEQVFLHTTEENYAPPESQKADDSEKERLTGMKLHFNAGRALLSKKLTYTLKTYSMIFTKIFTVFIILFFNFDFTTGAVAAEEILTELIHLILGAYPTANVLYSSHDKTIGRQYATISESLGGNPIEVTDANIERALMNHAKDNLAIYDNHVIAAAEFNKTAFNAFYSEMAVYSLPISFNLLWNVIVKRLLGPDYSISLSSHDLPQKERMYLDNSHFVGPIIASLYVYQFCEVAALFVVHPRRETDRDVKQLQLMAGVSGLSYWGTMFIFDFLDYLILAALFVCGLSIIDSFLDVRLYGMNEICLESLLLVVFGINILPFVYIFTFINKKSSSLLKLLNYLAMGSVFAGGLIHLINRNVEGDGSFKKLSSILLGIMQLTPCVSFLCCEWSYFVTVLTNARCFRLPNEFYDVTCKNKTDVCCGMHCYDGTCAKPQEFFADDHLTRAFTYLCLTPLLYVVLLAAIESKLILKIYRKSKGRDDTAEPFSDEQVQNEHQMIYQRIQAMRAEQPNSTNDDVTISDEEAPDTQNVPIDRVYFVYELRKSYKDVKAVRDISFAVNRGECFGLLGVNGAGKSTAFRMMTGRELPDHGIMYMEGGDIESSRKRYLLQMGYCPQHDAIIKCMNTYEHLKLFARLRGIPETHVENAVETWIEKLNLHAYARQSSETLSGGNKRRLNIAMALIGNPSMIFMDEPTTGVDPGARRSIWNIIKSCQMAGQSVILTSHSMEECEALCNRLAIMADGKLVCIGVSEELKRRFGAGYDIQIKIDPEKATDQVDGIKRDMRQSLDCELIDENLGHLMYHVAPADTTWRKMYDVMNAMKSKYDCIDEFLVLSSTLEQLFLLFARRANSEA